MKNLNIIFFAVAIGLTSCKNEKKDTNAVESVITETVDAVAPKALKIDLQAKSDSNVSGEVVFNEKNGVVSMVATISGLTAGEHAIHIHNSSDCSSADGKSAGGHWNPTAKPHGKWGAEAGHHKGDIGNFIADENGNGTIAFSTDQWCIGCGDETKDILSKGVIVHAGTDDFTSQPSGAAGARVSCAGIIQ